MGRLFGATERPEEPKQQGGCQPFSAGYLVGVSETSLPLWPDHPALFLDLDGTLLEFSIDPAAVQVPERVRTILGMLADVTGGAIAFVSGRTLSELDRLLGAERFPLAAVHGLQRRDARGRVSTSPADEDALNRMHETLDRIARQFPKTFVEHKDISLALHYRQCPDLEETLVQLVQERLEPRLKLLRGNMVLEMRPFGEDKGTAIAAFMEEAPFRGRTPVFVGDDVTDEDGFVVVNDLGGVSVKVGSGPTGARYRLADTAAVIDWLDSIAAGEPA